MAATVDERTTELSEQAREAVRDLILVMADSKRLLGMRYGEWMLGAADLEAGIACAAMTQDEWGHARQFYAMLKEFDEDPDRIEHGRGPEEYRNIEVLDRSPRSWPELVVVNALADTALAVQCDAMIGSTHGPLALRVEKILEEEQFHFAHGVAWFRRLARAGEEARAALTTAVEDALPVILRWFGPDSERAERLKAEGVVDAAGDALRDRFLDRVGGLIDELGTEVRELAARAPDFDGFDESTRRATRDGPDAETVARIRGDKNAAFRLD
ncbi:MAG: Phenylacetic acid catabolic protein [Gemmatimonadota bacterium]